MKEKIRIVVEGFPEDKKKLVQDAMFKLGYLWGGGSSDYEFFNNSVAYYYGADDYLTYNYISERECHILDLNIIKTLTFNQLMEKAGMSKQHIKPEDEVTITTTYGELARAYAVLGSINGNWFGKSLWANIGNLLDPSRELYQKFMFQRGMKPKEDYQSMQKEWLNALFTPPKTDNQIQQELLGKQLKDLQTQMDMVQSQYNKLKGE